MLFILLGIYLGMEPLDHFVTPWTAAHQAPLSLGFPGKNTGMGCHFLLQGIFSTQGLKSPALAGGFFATETPWKSQTTPPQW